MKDADVLYANTCYKDVKFSEFNCVFWGKNKQTVHLIDREKWKNIAGVF